MNDIHELLLIVGFLAWFSIGVILGRSYRPQDDCPSCGEVLSYDAKEDLYHCARCDDYYEMTLYLVEEDLGEVEA